MKTTKTKQTKDLDETSNFSKILVKSFKTDFKKFLKKNKSGSVSK